MAIANSVLTAAWLWPSSNCDRKLAETPSRRANSRIDSPARSRSRRTFCPTDTLIPPGSVGLTLRDTATWTSLRRRGAVRHPWYGGTFRNSLPSD